MYTVRAWLNLQSYIELHVVITKGQQVWVTSIRGSNAFAPSLCFEQVSHDRWTKHACSDSEGRRTRHLRSNCHLYIPFILSTSPNKSWLHTCDTCVITTCRGIASPQTCRPGPTNFWFYHSTAWKIKGCLRLTCGLLINYCILEMKAHNEPAIIITLPVY